MTAAAGIASGDVVKVVPFMDRRNDQ